MIRVSRLLTLVLASVLSAIANDAYAQPRTDVWLNRPYSDMRAWHMGFSVGTHVQDLIFTNNGAITANGETWFVEQPSFSPGFCVNGLYNLRLSNFFSLRLTPGMYFGNKVVKMLDTTHGASLSQDIKSTYVVVPFDVKYSALRCHNLRPYLTAGVMPAFDVSKKRSEYLKLKTSDFYISVGVGCDFYLPFFKLSPELKFCFGLSDVIEHDRPDLIDDPERMKITTSLKKATSQMVVLTFYFE